MPLLLILTALLALPASAEAQIEGQYTGLFGFYRNDNLRADLTIKSGSRFDGELTFWYFKETFGPERAEFKAEISGRYDQRARTVVLTFKKWIGQAPKGDFGMLPRRGVVDPDLGTLKGDGFEFARKGTPAAAGELRRQQLFESLATRVREQDDRLAVASGAVAREQERIAAATRDVVVRDAEKRGTIAAAPSGLDRARGLAERCAILADWAGRMTREIPGARANSAAMIMMALNSFRDEDFVPVFGRAYDQTTPEWRASIYKNYLADCFTGKDGTVRSRVDLQLAALLLNAFRDPPVNGYGPPRIAPIVASRRTLALKLSELVRVDPPRTTADLADVVRRIGDLPSFAELWPGEIAKARADLKKAGLQGVVRWQTELAALSTSLENAKRLQDDAVRWREPVASLDDGEARSRVVAVDRQLDDMLTALTQTRVADVQNLRAVRGPNASWASWRADFERDFKPFARPALDLARQRAWTTIAPLLVRSLPQWEAEIRALPNSTEGTETARAAMADVFADGGSGRRPAVFYRYEMAVARAKGVAIGRQLEDRDAVESFRWYQIAADLGNADAQFAIAREHFKRQYFRESAAWFLMAALQNHAPSQLALGQQYSAGSGLPLDYAEAARWFTRAADQGFPAAQFELGRFLRDGRGLARNEQRSLELFRRSAEAGDADAQVEVARYLERRAGGNADATESTRWYTFAAEQGHHAAQLTLCAAYGKSQRSSDPVRAYLWCELAGRTDVPSEAVTARRLREEIADRLPETELERARRLVQTWVPAKWDDLKAAPR